VDKILKTTAAVIMAAGNSSRLGQPKQLLKWQGRSLLQRAVDYAGEAGCSPIVVVLGYEAEKMARELEKSGATICLNEKWRRGLGSSLKAGIRALEPDRIHGALFMVCDQLHVSARLLLGLILAAESDHNPASAAWYAGKPGVPAWIHSSLFSGLLALEDGAGAKEFLMGLGDRVSLRPFPKGVADIDLPEDLMQMV